MYKINTKVDKPDTTILYNRASELMRSGIKVADMHKAYSYFDNLVDTLYDNVCDICGISNPNSSKQVAGFLEEESAKIEMHEHNDILEMCYDDSNNKWTSNASALSVLADLGYEFASALLEYRKAKKYYDTIKKFVESADANGFVHPVVSMSKTNRVNYREPALMNIPKKLLWAMIAPYSDDELIVSVDIKNQEPGILINLTGSEELKPYLNSDEGFYNSVFKHMFAAEATATLLVDTLPEDKIYSIDELKQMPHISPAYYMPLEPDCLSYKFNGKRVVHIEQVCAGISFGKNIELPDKVAIELEDSTVEYVSVDWQIISGINKRKEDYTIKGKLHGIEIDLLPAEREQFKTHWLAMTYGEAAKSVIDGCKTINGRRLYKEFSQVPGIKKYHKLCKQAANNGVNTLMTVFGTPVSADYTTLSNKLYRSLLDIPIQGTGADVLNLLAAHFDNVVEENGYNNSMKLYFTRHDELVLRVKKSLANEMGMEQLVMFMKDTFEHQIDSWTPFKVEVNVIDTVSDVFEEVMNGYEE